MSPDTLITHLKALQAPPRARYALVEARHGAPPLLTALAAGYPKLLGAALAVAIVVVNVGTPVLFLRMTCACCDRLIRAQAASTIAHQ
mgnify:CR=1 FL=1